MERWVQYTNIKLATRTTFFNISWPSSKLSLFSRKMNGLQGNVLSFTVKCKGTSHMTTTFFVSGNIMQKVTCFSLPLSDIVRTIFEAINLGHTVCTGSDHSQRCPWGRRPHMHRSGIQGLILSLPMHLLKLQRPAFIKQFQPIDGISITATSRMFWLESSHLIILSQFMEYYCNSAWTCTKNCLRDSYIHICTNWLCSCSIVPFHKVSCSPCTHQYLQCNSSKWPRWHKYIANISNLDIPAPRSSDTLPHKQDMHQAQDQYSCLHMHCHMLQNSNLTSRWALV